MRASNLEGLLRGSAGGGGAWSDEEAECRLEP